MDEKELLAGIAYEISVARMTMVLVALSGVLTNVLIALVLWRVW